MGAKCKALACAADATWPSLIALHFAAGRGCRIQARGEGSKGVA